MKTLTPIAHQTGKCGEYRVISELISRGFRPCIPVIDCGADIVLDTGIRIQVKSSHAQNYKQYPNGFYRYALREKRRNVRERAMSIWSDSCDLFVFWAVDEDRFFICPVSESRGKGELLAARRDNKLHTPDPAEAKRLKAQGLGYGAIARTMGVCHLTAKHLVNGTRLSRFEMNAQILPKYENRWDLLDTNSVAALVEETVKVSS